MAIVSGVIMVPLYLKFIPTDVYGAWLASGNVLIWFSFFDPGLTVVLQQRIGSAYGKRDYQTIRELLGGGLFIAGVISISIIAIGFIIAPYLPLFLSLPPGIDKSLIVQAFSIAVIGTSLTVFSFSISAINQGFQSSLGFGLTNFIVTALMTVLTAVLLYKGFGLLAIAIASIFGGVFYTLGQGTYLIWRLTDEKIGFKFSFNNISALTKLLSYTFLGRVSGILANNVDLFVVSRFLGPETVTILSLTRKAPDYSKEFVNQPSVAFMPAISHLTGSGEIDKARKVLIRLIHMLLWILCLTVGGLIALNDDFVRLWVGPYLFAGKTINLIICVSLIFTFTANCFGNICMALGNIKGNSLAGLVQSLVFIPLVIFGTKYFGLLGTVLAPSVAILAVSAWYYSRTFSRLLKLSVQDRKNIMYEGFLALAVMVSLTLGFSWCYPENWFRFFALVAVFCFLYSCLIYLVSMNFRCEIKGVIQKLRILPT
ncbi:MAG: oligosaccharide flippase family protein [bacterium]